jgi:protein-disulfide isomerase
VTLIEYSDFECPFCKGFHTTAKQLVDRSNGQVNWAYRHFPLDMHNPGAKKEAEASECAAELGGNDAFWKFAEAVYTRTHSNGKGFPIENLVPLAVELGLNQDAFRQCLDSGRMAPRIQHDADSGAKAGVAGTPGNILLNTRTGKVAAVSGAQPYARLNDAVQQLLQAP